MRLQKTRIVCVSDTHGYTPSEAGFRLPAGDVLIHAGDLTNQGSKSELQKTIDWIVAADYEVKIVVCGNHDITLDEPFYSQNKQHFHNKQPQDPRECLDILTRTSPSLILLRHESALIRLTKANGPQTVFKVFGSPYSQRSGNGNWAFLYGSDKASEVWQSIPLDADIVVTHTPPRYHCDKAAGAAMGCAGLHRRLNRVRPCLAVCGHLHEARGYERVKWRPFEARNHEDADQDVDESLSESLVEEVAKGDLPPAGSKKQSLVDLTGKRAPRLDNDGLYYSSMSKNASSLFPPSQNVVILPRHRNEAIQATETRPAGFRDNDIDSGLRARGRETCIVNAAIMATNWPHRGGRKFHPGPIVVDLELPVWEEDDINSSPTVDESYEKINTNWTSVKKHIAATTCKNVT
ncbi:Metallo-dependent phosphatase-like protein [Aspergillus egyptiacus]|nr:Metallo-dependent phosphatase-like protein [Aspergillus egyptiacus]